MKSVPLSLCHGKMAYGVVERASPKENEKHDNVVVVTSLPISLLSVHYFPCTIKAKAEDVKMCSMAFSCSCLQGNFLMG